DVGVKRPVLKILDDPRCRVGRTGAKGALVFYRRAPRTQINYRRGGQRRFLGPPPVLAIWGGGQFPFVPQCNRGGQESEAASLYRPRGRNLEVRWFSVES